MAEGHHPAGALVLRGVAGVRTLMMVRSARNRSWEYSKTHAVRVLGRPGDRQQRQRPRRYRGSRPRPRSRRRPRCAPPPRRGRSRSAPRAGRRASRRGAGRAAGGTAPPAAATCSREIGEPSASRMRTTSIDVRPGLELQGGRGLLVRLGDRGGDDPRAGRHPLRPQQGGHAHDARQVALHLLRAHEGAAAPAGDAAYGARALECAQGLPHGRAAHAQLLRESALGPQPLARDAAARAGSGPAAGGVPARRPGRSRRGTHSRTVTGTQIPSSAAGDSGSTWPPSTTSVWPVMYPASSLAKKSAALPMSSTLPRRCCGMAASMPRM